MTISEYDFPEDTLAIATVRGVDDVLVIRRRCFPTGHGADWFDWAHSEVNGYTCSNDTEVIVKRTLTPTWAKRVVGGEVSITSL